MTIIGLGNIAVVKSNTKDLLQFSIAYNSTFKNKETGKYEKVGDTVWLNVMLTDKEQIQEFEIKEKDFVFFVGFLKFAKKGDKTFYNLTPKLITSYSEAKLFNSDLNLLIDKYKPIINEANNNKYTGYEEPPQTVYGSKDNEELPF